MKARGKKESRGEDLFVLGVFWNFFLLFFLPARGQVGQGEGKTTTQLSIKMVRLRKCLHLSTAQTRARVDSVSSLHGLAACLQSSHGQANSRKKSEQKVFITSREEIKQINRIISRRKCVDMEINVAMSNDCSS